MRACPTPGQLEEFLEERVCDADLSAIARHVDGCSHCQAALEDLTAEDLSSQSVSGLICAAKSADAMPPAQSAEAGFFARLKEAPPGRSGPLDGAGVTPVPSSSLSESGKFPSVANYEILGEVGRGGMGVVYKARQVGLDRLVALKMILAGPHAGPKDLVRFRQEAEAVARLRHPNIIQVYDIGESDGRAYLALEFVEGQSLAQLLRGTPQPLLPAARLVETLAGAIHYAHERNIVHRDLKPANVLLHHDSRIGADSQLATLSLESATAKITDFGLAKRLDGPRAPLAGSAERGEGSTQSGEVVGTPSYMAPEQAAGNGREVGPATDVYALGTLLYELLTGRPPFRGSTSVETVLQVLHEEPVRPSYFRDLPRDLETICLKCLAKEPAKRYASAHALADDLHRFRKGQPIKARPVGVHERVWKWARHRPLSAALVAGIFLVALLGFAGITWQWQEARLARDDMELQRQEAEEQRALARASLYFSRIAQSQLQWRVNDFAGAKQSLAKCFPWPGEEDQRGWEWHYLQGLLHNDLFTFLHGHGGQGGSVAYDARGERIASVVSGPAPGETALPGEVRIWNGRTGELLNTFHGPSTIQRLAFHPNGKSLALGGSDGSVMMWDAASGKELWRRPAHEQAVLAIALSPDGRTVASASADRTVKVWNSTTGEVVQELRGHGEAVQSVTYHPEGQVLATGSWDATVKLWDARTGRESQTLQGHQKAVYCVAFSPDGKVLVSTGGSGNLKVRELATGRIIQSLTGDAGAVLSIAFSPDGRYLAKGGKDGSVRVWHLVTGVERMSFRGHTGPVESVAFGPDCRRVVSLCPAEGVVKVWDLSRHPEYATFARTDADVEAVAFAESGQRLLSVTMAGKLQSWDASSGMLLTEQLLPLNKDILSPAVPMSFSPGGKFLAARSRDDPRLVKVWDTAGGTETAAFSGHRLAACCVRFSSDGRLLVTAAGDTASHEVKVWESASGTPLATLRGKGRIFNISFSPDGRLLAWGSQEGVVALAAWETSAEPLRIAAHLGDVSAVAFSADGKLLASTGMEERAVKIWKVQPLIEGAAVAWHTLHAPSLICDLAFHADGRRLVAASRDMIKVWEIDNGNEVLTLRGAPQRYWDPSFNPRLAFSPDGTQLAGSNWDESISIWEAPLLDSEEQFARFQAKRRRFADERTNFWHLQEAEVCLLHKNVAAARFHLQRIGPVPLPEPLQLRKERLVGVLKEER
jgi:WD40 repeat protein/serine/threonine protein kinase